MRFDSFYARPEPVISFEVFPPKTSQSCAQLEERLVRLMDLKPDFITVTYGAFGSNRDKTLEIACMIKGLGGETAHHLTCVGSSREDIGAILERIAASGIENIVALRGDPPRGQSEFKPAPGGYRYACDLVEHIRGRGGFSVAVAGYPEKHVEAVDFESDLQNLKCKVDAGADLVITQLFYDNAHYFRFVERCRKLGVACPIVPGLLPILDLNQIKRITTMCGATLPNHLIKRLQAADGHPERVFEVGIAHTADQAVELLEAGVPGIHFYVLNRCFHIAEIMSRIRFALEARGDRSGSRQHPPERDAAVR